MVISHKHILAINGLKGFGPKKINLIAEFLRGEETEQLRDYELCEIIRDLVHRKVIKGVKQFDSSELMFSLNHASDIIEKSLAKGVSIISRYDEGFPSSLLKTVDEEGKETVPLYLFYKGDISITNRKSVAIIGTREPSPEGEKASEFLAKSLAENGVNIVSGLALGCDSAAHKGAIEGKGVTTATLGNGLDKIYPPENKYLADSIVDNGGLLISEYPLGEEASSYTLVARDRIQAALSQSVIVIQTSENGGTMHAVNSASIVGKQVFAVDYHKYLASEFISGNHSLIQRQIAKPIGTTLEDVTTVLDSLKNVETITPEGTQFLLF